jgi:hypothetical protein
VPSPRIPSLPSPMPPERTCFWNAGTRRRHGVDGDAQFPHRRFVRAGSEPYRIFSTCFRQAMPKPHFPHCPHTWTPQSPAAFNQRSGSREFGAGSLKVFGLRIGTVTRRTFEARVLELVAEDRSLMATTEPMLRVRRALSEEFERLDRLCRQLVRRDTVCRRLMTIPGVGTVVALTYRTGIDAPERFSRSRDVGTHFGLTPRRYSSGQTDYDGRISCCGDAMVRTALYQAANVLFITATGRR